MVEREEIACKVEFVEKVTVCGHGFDSPFEAKLGS
jgi:hypothetical protein